MFQSPPTNLHKATGLWLLLLIVNTFLTVAITNAFQQETIVNYRCFSPSYSFDYPETPSQSEMFPSRSHAQCAINTLKNQTGFFSYDKVNKLCKTYPQNIVLTASNSNSNDEKSFYLRDHWIKVYSISEGAGSDVYKSFLNIGERTSWNVDFCIGLYCPNFFRHSILDAWEQIPVYEVKLVLYEKQNAVVTMVFNGRDTTLKNWFSPKNLKSSPWNDLPKSKPNYFSLSGYKEKRRFYVSYDHVMCGADSGWLAIIERFHACHWEVSLVYPRFFYSTTSSKATWLLSYGSADTLAIFIRLVQE